MTDAILVIKSGELKQLIRAEFQAAIKGMAHDDEPMNIESTSDYLHVSISTVRRYLRSKKLRAQKIGRQWRIMRSELERFAKGAE